MTKWRIIQKTKENMGRFYLLTVDKESKKMLDKFDFEMVHKIMELMNWKYGYPDGIDRIPTVEEIKHMAIEVLKRCIRTGHRIECGGFIAELDDEHYRLVFEAVGWMS